MIAAAARQGDNPWISEQDLKLIESLTALQPGQTMSRVDEIPRDTANKDVIYHTKRALTNTLTKAISRVKERHPVRVYRIHSHHHITDNLDVVVVVVVTREEDEL